MLHCNTMGPVIQSIGFICALSGGSLPPEIGELEHERAVDDLITAGAHEPGVVVDHVEVAGRFVDPAQQNVADNPFPSRVVEFVIVPLEAGCDIEVRRSIDFFN